MERRRRDLGLRRCDRVAVEQKFNMKMPNSRGVSAPNVNILSENLFLPNLWS